MTWCNSCTAASDAPSQQLAVSHHLDIIHGYRVYRQTDNTPPPPLSYDSHGDPFPATNWEPVDSGHNLELREIVSLAS